jgi:uncharacterized ion transporter superfamily protein YfcC
MVRKLPDTLVIVLFIMVVFTGLTWLIPAGEFQRHIVLGREVIIPDSFAVALPNPQNLFDFLTTPIKGFVASSQIIAFVFIVGGAFGMLNKTGAINSGLQSIVEFSLKYPQYKKFIIPIVMVFFSLAGATFGMSEEVLVFVLITLPLAYALGYDSLVGVAIPFVGAGVGFAGAFLNPFTIGIAQGIAELPPFSGWEYRIIIWAILTIAAISFVMVYANKIEKDPSKSLLFNNDISKNNFNKSKENNNFSLKQKLVLILFILSIFLLIYGVNNWDWYINEIAGMFFCLGILSSVLGGLKLNEMTSAFTEGAKDMMTAALVIALSNGILIIAKDGKIIDTILFHVSDMASGYPKALSVQMMFFVQSFFNFFLPSGSGQAALTMPIMTPLSDLLQISRQTAVLAYQFGDGLSNLIIPTSGVTMGVLAIGKVPYDKWLKWMMPLIIILFILAMLLLVPPTLFFEWGPM